MNSSLRNPARKGEGGQVLIVFVLGLAVLMGFVAMSVDVGLILQERRHLQNAADAAALAGAQELPGSPAAAVALAQQYAEAHGVDLTDPDYTFVATTPYLADPGKIEVTLSHDVGFIFGRVLGLDIANVPARAVAGLGVSSTYAIFQTDPGCNGILDLEDLSTFFIDGAVHADGQLELEPSPFDVTGGATFCGSLKDNSTSWTGAAPDQVPASVPIPPSADFSYADFPCNHTFSGSPWKISLAETPGLFVSGTTQLQPGVYCSSHASGDIELAEPNVTGNVTFVLHGNFEFEGDNFNLTSYYKNVLVFTDAPIDDPIDPLHGEPQIKSEDKSGQWEGMLLAPNGLVKFERMISATSPGTLILGSFIDLGGVWNIAGQNDAGLYGLVILVE